MVPPAASGSKLPAVDSIPHYPGEVLAGIQVTIRDKHAIGLKRILGWLKQRSPLTRLLDHARPLAPHIRGPAAVAASLEQQVFEGNRNGLERLINMHLV